MASFDEVLKDCTKLGTKIPTSEYLENGKYPIIDQGQNDIAGYYDSDDGLFEDVPTIVFGDHTRVVKYVDKPCFLGADGVKLLCPLDKDINCKYLFYQLSCADIPNTGYNRHFKWVKALDFKIPSSDEQNHVVEVLDKVTELISLRKQQLARLDELVKARFVEMFGDPVVNSKRWPVETIENHIDLLTGFPFDSSGYVSKGINICGGLIIMPQKIDWSACKHWPQVTGYEDYILRPNDIVIALDRPWISNGFKIAMVDKEHLPALLIQRTARIRAVDINQHYLMQSLLLGRFDKHCNITGSLVPHISPKDIKSYSVMIPPIELQNQFSTFVERVDQQKQTVQQSLEKLELMKKALMQEYFG